MIKLMILTWGYFPGLSQWVLSLITHDPVRERQTEITHIEDKAV